MLGQTVSFVQRWRWVVPPHWLLRWGAARRQAEAGRLLASSVDLERRILAERFERELGYPLRLSPPRTFNEKIQWRKLYDRRPLFPLLADKYRVREYVRRRVGGEYLVPLRQVADSLSGVRVEDLKEPSVIKPTHASGIALFVRGPHQLSRELLHTALGPAMRAPYGLYCAEWAYWSIPPQVIVEPLLVDGAGRIPADYKFHCFDGEARFVEVHLERHTAHRCQHFTRDWEPLDIRWGPPPPERPAPRPHGLAEMLEVADALSSGLDYVRVDLYNLDERVYFGEMTLYPASGFDPAVPVRWDHEFGRHWTLPEPTRN